MINMGEKLLVCKFSATLDYFCKFGSISKSGILQNVIMKNFYDTLIYLDE